MLNILSFAPLVSGIIGALIGVFVSRWLIQKKEQLETTIKMYNQWHSIEMFRDRKISWKFITREFIAAPFPFHNLFNDKSKLDDEIVDSVSRVLYFWHSFHVLKKQNMLYDKVLSDLFRYQYSHWVEALEPMYLATIEDGKDIPEWCVLFKEKQEEWIYDTTKHVE